MRVIITGPTGAIGHALIEECLEHGDEVLAICHPGSKRIASLPKSDLLEIMELDLADYGKKAKELSEPAKNPYDIFFHFAWKGTTGADRNDTGLQKENGKASLEAVLLARTFGCHTFIGAGSQAEYGRFEGLLKPDTEPYPENAYGKVKLATGVATRALCKNLQMRHIWTRVLSIYGPYDGEKSMIISSLRKMTRGDNAQFTKGEQKWDYLFSKDAGRAFYLLAQKGIDGKVYVIGSGKREKLSDYINVMTEKVKLLTGNTPEIELGAIPYGEKQVMYLCADLTELTKDTGFVPETEFEEGIGETIRYVLKTNME